MRYVALGDSYTIGTSVTDAENWPSQLAARLPDVQLVANLAVNGFTSRDVIERELPQLEGLRPDLVTLLIGVNDVVQGVPDVEYTANVHRLLDVIGRIVPATDLVCVATPDYTATPSGADYGDPAAQSDRIGRVNTILREACEARGIAFVPEIFEISQGVAEDSTLVASDGLHPSGAQYALWTDAIESVVRQALNE